jgi:hypothetical protein
MHFKAVNLKELVPARVTPLSFHDFNLQLLYGPFGLKQ